MSSSKKTVTSVAADISKHEAVCAERYAGIIQRLTRLEACLLGATSLLICGMATIIWTSFK